MSGDFRTSTDWGDNDLMRERLLTYRGIVGYKELVEDRFGVFINIEPIVNDDGIAITIEVNGAKSFHPICSRNEVLSGAWATMFGKEFGRVCGTLVRRLEEQPQSA